MVLFGSGETSANGRKVYDWLLSHLPQPIEMAVLETPAGFQPNSTRVAEKVAGFVRHHLQNYRPRVEVVPARKRGTPWSPDDPEILAPLLRARALFLGPGSPTYTVRQLENSLAWRYLVAKHRLGAALVFASAASIAVGAHALPVYEIYKAGADLHWCRGLDLFGPFGLPLVFVPHWNNSEGGAELDTSRCYMGRERFRQLLALLPEGMTVVGIDEHTALVVDFAAESCRVMGRGGVTLLRQGVEVHFGTGQSFPMQSLGPFRLPASSEGTPEALREAVLATEAEPEEPEAPPTEVLALVDEREAARVRRDWAVADSRRERIADLGWQVADTPEGPQLSRVPEDQTPRRSDRPVTAGRGMALPEG